MALLLDANCSQRKIVSVLGIMLEVNLLRQYEHFYIEINVAPSSVPVNYKGEYCCHPLNTQKWTTNHFVTHWWVTNLVVTHLTHKSGQQIFLSPIFTPQNG